ncbi:MAG: rod shape-determining protein MreC [Alphaproteobacteria bacterium]|nr:rod shape-determining protein MreC [Alphaproteobacteria bacterium]
MTLRRRSFARSLSRLAPFPFLGAGGNFFFMVLSIIILFISAMNANRISDIRMMITDLVAPVMITLNKPMQETAAMIQELSGLADLRAENQRLLLENNQLREWFEKAQTLNSENMALRDLLNVVTEPQHSYVTARVIADSGNTFMKSILVTAGQSDKVKSGQAVISNRGVLGRVVEAGQITARVLLINDINSRIPVWLEENQQHAILAGQNDDLPQLVHLPPHVKIRDGSRVVTSGFGGMFPKGLPVGKVVVDPQGFYRVVPFADLSQIMYVRIVERAQDPDLLPAQ